MHSDGVQYLTRFMLITEVLRFPADYDIHDLTHSTAQDTHLQRLHSYMRWR